MNKELVLVRHADATAAEVGQKDAERELSLKGYQDVTRLGHYLYEQQQNIDLLLASTARRAQQTAEVLTEQMRYGNRPFRFSEHLYQASVRSLLDIINAQAASVGQLMIVGHNPTLTYLTEYLTGEAVNSMVPGGLVLLRLTVEQWSEVSQHTASLAIYLEPDRLRSG